MYILYDCYVDAIDHNIIVLLLMQCKCNHINCPAGDHCICYWMEDDFGRWLVILKNLTINYGYISIIL